MVKIVRIAWSLVFESGWSTGSKSPYGNRQHHYNIEKGKGLVTVTAGHQQRRIPRDDRQVRTWGGRTFARCCKEDCQGFWCHTGLSRWGDQQHGL